MLPWLQFSSQPTHHRPKHEQESTDEEAKLDRILRQEPINNTLGLLEDLPDTKNRTNPSLDQITQ